MPSNFPKSKTKLCRNGLKDWFDLLILDHGFLRIWWHNFHKVDNYLWRSNQPTPGRIEDAYKKGIKTIINLRGVRNDGGWQLEAEACKKFGLKLIDFTARSRAVPDKEMIYAAKKLFSSIEYPALIHCKSGADRAGIMSALYLIIVKNLPVSTAIKELSIRYGHIKYAKTGLLDHFLLEFKKYQNEGVSFFDWIEKHYDPTTIESKFKTSRFANYFVNNLLNRE
tara:strand:- start:430 stop:1101 length:672 start_codon:yes stop_codon:yes gene_type:complete